jgi:hypothetical protein
MVKKYLLGVIVILLVATVVSCNKEAADAPGISIITPGSDTTFSAYDSITVKALLSDTRELHEASITFYDSASGFVYYTDSPYVHNLESYVISNLYKNFWDTAYNGTIILNVSARDHDGHMATEERHLTITP